MCDGLLGWAGLARIHEIQMDNFCIRLRADANVLVLNEAYREMAARLDRLHAGEHQRDVGSRSCQADDRQVRSPVHA